MLVSERKPCTFKVHETSTSATRRKSPTHAQSVMTRVTTHGPWAELGVQDHENWPRGRGCGPPKAAWAITRSGVKRPARLAQNTAFEV